MRVLLSIKPEFAEKIFNGTKKYEFRKSIFKRADIKTIVVYVSAPVKQVVGEFTIADILAGDVDRIWAETSRSSGISHKFYLDYFNSKEKAYAIKIGHTERFRKPRTLQDYNIDCAPQSFVYIP